MAAAANGINNIQLAHRRTESRRSQDSKATPVTMVAVPAAINQVSRSSRNSNAVNSANAADVALIELEIVGPMSRVDSKFRIVTAAGKNKPITANRAIAGQVRPFIVSNSGAASQNINAVDGTLIDAPTRGDT